MSKTWSISKRKPYVTRSNKYRPVKKNNGKLVAKLVKKTGKAPSCGECKIRLLGIDSKRPAAFARLKKSQRTVARTFGGTLCANCLRQRIFKVFMDQELMSLEMERLQAAGSK